MTFLFHQTSTTEIYTLSLHDALPILRSPPGAPPVRDGCRGVCWTRTWEAVQAERCRMCVGDETRSEEHTSELQSHSDLVCRLLPEKKIDDETKRPASPQSSQSHQTPP